MKTADRVASLLIIGICIYFWIESRSFVKLGKLFPRVIIIILGALSVALFILSFRSSEDRRIFETHVTRYTPILITILLTIVWGYLINVLGFYSTSLIIFLIMNAILDRKKRGAKRTVLKYISIIMIVTGFYLFFSKILLVPFPSGLLI